PDLSRILTRCDRATIGWPPELIGLFTRGAAD
ncbi:unnamed protein product, partial [marine sediment metagenome]